MLYDTVVHHSDLVRHCHRLQLVVGDVDCGGTDPVMQLPQFPNHQIAKLGIQRAKRFIHQKAFGPADDRPSERHALAISASQTRYRPVKNMIDLQQPRGLLDARADFRFGNTLREERKPDVLAYIHVRIKRKELEDKSNIPLPGSIERDIFTAKEDLAASRQLKTRNHPQGRCLAAT